MEKIHWFYLGAAIDMLALLIGIYFVVKDSFSASGGTNNPAMYKALFFMTALIGGAIWLQQIGKIGLANILLWIPGTLLAGYGVMILLFIILKPDMR